MASNLPQRVDVAVIGGGIIGISTAWALAKAGVRAAVFEKGVVAGEQSSRNWGWIRTVGRDPKELPLALRAIDLWREIQARRDVGYRQTGLAYLAETEQDMAAHRAWLDKARPSGVSAELIGRDGLPALLGCATTRAWAGALYSGIDGVAEPDRATRAQVIHWRADGSRDFDTPAPDGADRP